MSLSLQAGEIQARIIPTGQNKTVSARISQVGGYEPCGLASRPALAR
ncbi:hypothetical protein [Thermanaeromonas sp. C210]|nr:hypothetical protein [Thermanaeromonas sp. C210]GFN23522.1 hypothetical protein TAMC210_18390 [Thermanaeromonas sp. C210]